MNSDVMGILAAFKAQIKFSYFKCRPQYKYRSNNSIPKVYGATFYPLCDRVTYFLFCFILTEMFYKICPFEHNFVPVVIGIVGTREAVVLGGERTGNKERGE
jgi:hypothetical protein